MQNLKINTDGGSRGNPGPAAIGVVIKTNDNLVELSECIGQATNNQAEYRAVIRALDWVKENIKDTSQIDFFLDSELVVEQLCGRYKMKNEGLRPLFLQIKDLIGLIGGNVTFSHVCREQNKEADRLVNKALDGEKEFNEL